MPDLGELVDDVIGQLYGYVDVPAMGTLTAPLTATDTTATFDFGDQPGAARPNGIVEIDSELMIVSRFDAASGTAALSPWGRGHGSTVAATHAAGSKVTVRPRFPRKRVADTIREVIRSICPPLFAAVDLGVIPIGRYVDVGYPLPARTLRVLSLDATRQFDTPVFGDRVRVRDWTVRAVAGQKLLEVRESLPYFDVQVTIAAEPGELVAETDDFATVTGLDIAVADLVVLGAISRLVLSAELARQQLLTPEAMGRADKVPAQSGVAVSRYYQALFTQRLQQEQDRLLQQYPPQLIRRG